MALRCDNVSRATAINSRLLLNDGSQMPWFGLGMYLSEPGQSAEHAVCCAIQHGYRLIDTAQFYRNEADVGRGIKHSGVKRSEIFVVSKVQGANHGYDECIASFHESLAKLDTGYIDLFLIHAPVGGKNIDTYRAMIYLKNLGLIHSIGVSNFGVQHLEQFRLAGLPTPSVNQIELHCFHRKNEIVRYCIDNGIAVMGYSPIAKARHMDDPDLVRLSKIYRKSVAQIMIRWSLQKGYITIPKSSNSERIVENADVFDFKLSDDEMNLFDRKPQATTGWDPTKDPWEG